MLSWLVHGQSFCVQSNSEIGKRPFVSNFTLLAHLFGGKWAITRNGTNEVPGQISRSPKGTKSKCYSKILYNIVQPYNKLLFLLSHRQSPIYSGFLFATAQVESNCYDLLRIYFFNRLFDKNSPCKRGIKTHCFCSLVQKGEHAFHVFAVKRIYK